MRSDPTAIVPKHIGIIMDGNGRWATKRLQPRNYGHKVGVQNIVPVVSAAYDRGVKCVTLYAFSSENRSRSKDEVEGLVDLIRKRIRKMAEDLFKSDASIRFSGDLSFFPGDVRKTLADLTEECRADNDRWVNIALNYGGRDEIVHAANVAAKYGEITAETLEQNLYTAGLPALDMIIRTGGEKRLSNFLLYQAAYSELFFTDTLWPDFGEKELDKMLEEFGTRTRKFGK